MTKTERRRSDPEYRKADNRRTTEYRKRRMRLDPQFKAIQYAKIESCHRRLKAQVMAAYGGKCVCCGEDILELLTIDHKHGGGNKERKLGLLGGRPMYRRLRVAGYPKGYQVMCFNCNIAKGLFGMCPHNRGWVKHAKKRGWS